MTGFDRQLLFKNCKPTKPFSSRKTKRGKTNVNSFVGKAQEFIAKVMNFVAPQKAAYAFA